jgi:hypothetical protein
MVVAANMFKPPQIATAQQRDSRHAVANKPSANGASARSMASRALPRVQRAAKAPGELIGELQGREYRVRIYAGVPEAMYDVLSAEGSVLGKGLTLKELPERFPDLDPASLHMQGRVVGSPDLGDGDLQQPASGPLMYADEHETMPR